MVHERAHDLHAKWMGERPQNLGKIDSYILAIRYFHIYILPYNMSPVKCNERIESNWYGGRTYFSVGLLMRGYSEQQIAKIVGGNILRVLEDVQAVATGG